MKKQEVIIQMHNVYFEDTPYNMARNGITTDTMHFVTPRWSCVPAWHCIECGKKYDKRHTTKIIVRLYYGTFRVYSAKSGYCPECAESHRDDPATAIITEKLLPSSRDVYEHHSGETDSQKYGEVIETYRDGRRESYCL
jgi:hypothetical protein